MAFEAELRKWWDGLADDQRARLTQAAENDRLESSTMKLLFDTGCPLGPIGTRWESDPDPDFDWTWPNSVRTFINTQ